jgi:hypothetical protein
MKDLTVKLKNIEYAYDVAMKNLTKVAKKEILRAAGNCLPVYIKDLVVDNIAIKRIQVMDPENMIINIEDTNGQIYNWDTLPETVKIKIYNHLSFNRILR